MTDCHRAWAKSCGWPGAGAWLLPATSPAHVLVDTQFRTAVKLRLFGIFLETECQCPNAGANGTKCASTVDRQGHHWLSDPFGGGLVRCYNAVKMALVGLLKDAGHTNVEVEQVLGGLS